MYTYSVCYTNSGVVIIMQVYTCIICSCLLFESGRLLKLCDFGTTTKEEHTFTNDVGTVMYMAPEVIRGDYLASSPGPSQLFNVAR